MLLFYAASELLDTQGRKLCKGLTILLQLKTNRKRKQAALNQTHPANDMLVEEFYNGQLERKAKSLRLCKQAHMKSDYKTFTLD